MIARHPEHLSLWAPGEREWRRLALAPDAPAPLATWAPPEGGARLATGRRASPLVGVAGALLSCDWETMEALERWPVPGAWAWEGLWAWEDWVCGADGAGRLHLWHEPTRHHAWARLEGARVVDVAMEGPWLAALLAPGGVRVWRLESGRPSLHMRALDRRCLPSMTTGREASGALAMSGDLLIGWESHPLDARTGALPGWQGVLTGYDVVSGRAIWQADVDAETTGDLRGLLELTGGVPLATMGLVVDGSRMTCGTAHGCLLTLDARDGALRDYRSTGSTRPVRHLFHGPQGHVWAWLEQGWLVRTSAEPGGIY